MQYRKKMKLESHERSHKIVFTKTKKELELNKIRSLSIETKAKKNNSNHNFQQDNKDQLQLHTMSDHNATLNDDDDININIRYVNYNFDGVDSAKLSTTVDTNNNYSHQHAHHPVKDEENNLNMNTEGNTDGLNYGLDMEMQLEGDLVREPHQQGNQGDRQFKGIRESEGQFMETKQDLEDGVIVETNFDDRVDEFSQWTQQTVILWLKQILSQTEFTKEIVDSFVMEFEDKHVNGAMLTLFKQNEKPIDKFITQFSMQNQAYSIWLEVKAGIDEL